MVVKKYTTPAWQTPNLGLRASKEIVDKQRLLLRGQSVPNLNPDDTWGKRAVGKNTRCQWRRDQSLVNLTHLEYHQQPVPWRTHTSAEHDNKLRSQSAREEQKQIAAEGARSASAKVRQSQDLKYFDSHLATIVDVDPDYTPNPTNLMPKHPYTAPKPGGVSRMDRNASQIQFGATWHGQSSTTRADFSKTSIANFEARPPVHTAKVLHVDLERHCDGPPDPILSHNSLIHSKKFVEQMPRRNKREGNVSQPAMQCVMSRDPEYEANYVAPHDRPFKAAVGERLEGGNRYSKDMNNMMNGKWFDDSRTNLYETEVGKEFTEKAKKYLSQKLATEGKITQSTVTLRNSHDVAHGDPYATTTAQDQAEAAQAAFRKSKPKARFPKNRGAAEVGENMSNGEFFGPRIVDQKVGEWDPRLMTGLHYDETSINRGAGVNVAEYGRQEVWDVKPPQAQVNPERYSNKTKSQWEFAHGPDTDPKHMYTGDKKGGWYKTAYNDYLKKPKPEHYSSIQKEKGRSVKSTVPNLEPSNGSKNPVDVAPEDVYNRSVPVSHEQFVEYPNKSYVTDYKDSKYVKAERARNGSDMIIWRQDSTGLRFQHRVAHAERGQTKAGRNIYPSR